ESSFQSAIPVLLAAEFLVDPSQNERGLVVLRLNRCGLLEELGGCIELALIDAQPGKKVVRVVQTWIQSNRGSKLSLRFGMILPPEGDISHRQVGLGQLRIQSERPHPRLLGPI